jgi:hypothetical protein
MDHWSAVYRNLIAERFSVQLDVRGLCPCGDGFEYLHRNPASRRRRRKRNPVPAVITGSQCYWGIQMRGPSPPGWGESRIWDSKMWLWISRDSDPRMTALMRTSSNCKQQTQPLVKTGCYIRAMTARIQLKENRWPWVSRGLAPRGTDWR